MERDNEGSSTCEGVITEEMIFAAVEVLLGDPFLDIPEGSAERLVEKMLKRALAIRHAGIYEGDRK